MKKPISVSNLTLDLYLDYVRPAAIAAGIIELTVTEDGKQIYVTDTATADEIAHCMYCACMCAGNDGIERTHEEYVRHEAERMIGQLEVSIKYDLHGYGEALTVLLDAMTAAQQEAPAAEAEQQPTETENAPQAATQAADGTDEKKEDKTMTTTEREALERINARQNAVNHFTNIGPADIAAELAAMEAEQAAPAPDPDAACVWDEDGNTITTEETTTNEQKEEDNTMSSTERYDYLEHMTADVIDAIKERYTHDEIREHMDDDRDEFAQELNDDLWTDDSVTGNASGSYYCNAWRAEEAIAHNWDLIADFIDEWDCADILRKGPEAIDVSIRCYLLGQAIDAALDELDDEIPEADDDNTEDDEDDNTEDDKEKEAC